MRNFLRRWWFWLGMTYFYNSFSERHFSLRKYWLVQRSFLEPMDRIRANFNESLL